MLLDALTIHTNMVRISVKIRPVVNIKSHRRHQSQDHSIGNTVGSWHEDNGQKGW
jgi:hypothetical protein